MFMSKKESSAEAGRRQRWKSSLREEQEKPHAGVFTNEFVSRKDAKAQRKGKESHAYTFFAALRLCVRLKRHGR
jgi:hypothetical protein